MLGANSICDTRRSMKTSTPAAPSRTSMTVLACRGAAAAQRSPASQPRGHLGERPGVSGKWRPTSVTSQGDDDLDLDRRIEREGRDTDGGAGVNSLVAKGFPEQLTGAVDDAGLPGEARVGCHEADDLDERVTRSRSPISDLIAAMALSAQVAASALASSALTSAPTLPVAASAPSCIGSWPEVNTRSPSRTTGT